jgi:hypothetical protein
MTREYVLILIAGVLVFVVSCYWLWLRKSRAAPVIDESYAIDVVKKTLAISGPLTATRLTGGYTSALLFRVTDGTKDFVVRVLADVPLVEFEQGIANLQVASAGGYGPQVYFADPVRGVVVMEYLPHDPVRLQKLSPDRVAELLADILRAIHQGPRFSGSRNIFEYLGKELKKLREGPVGQAHPDIPIARLEEFVRVLQNTALARVPDVPCHNDLHPSNLRFAGDSFKAIDFDDALQSNPYYDLAMVAIFQAIDEWLLLEKYLGHVPSPREYAQLYLMKQVVRINHARVFLKWGPAIAARCTSGPAPSWFEGFTKGITDEVIDFGRADGLGTLAKSTINKVLASAETQEFRDAVKLLS